MILKVQDYFKQQIPSLTFGQIQDSPDNLINFNLVVTNKRLFYKDDNTYIIQLTTFVRDATFEGMQNNNGMLLNLLSDTFAKEIDGGHIVTVKQNDSFGGAERDYKDRYIIQTVHEIIVLKE